MKFFIDLIAKSYIEYTQENDDNIAQFYFQEFYKVRPEANTRDIYSKKQFYTKLIKKLDSLIKEAIPRPRDIDFNTTNQEIVDQINMIQFEEESRHDEAREHADYQIFLEQEGLPIPKIFNWEECMDAKKLIQQIKKRGFTLKDPISIINPSLDNYSEPLVLRKSKLEYLKKEAVRASEATTITELDDPQDMSVECSISSNESISDIESKVKKAFEFTLKLDPRKKKQILSEADNIKLVEWVTYYFENNFNLPAIENPILNVNTSDGNIIWTFKILFDDLFPNISRKDSLYELLKLCFKKYINDNIENYKKRGEPPYYFELISPN